MMVESTLQDKEPCADETGVLKLIKRDYEASGDGQNDDAHVAIDVADYDVDAKDDLARDAIQYDLLLGKIDTLLESLGLTA